MKVLVDCRGISPTNSGGIENYAYCTVAALARFVKEIALDVDAADRDFYAAQFGAHSNVGIISDPLSGRLSELVKSRSVLRTSASVLRRLQPRLASSLMGRRAKWAALQNADVVYYPFHGHWPQHPHLPMVTTIHAVLPGYDKLMKATIRAHMTRARAIVTSWPHPFAELSAMMGSGASRLFMVPYTPWHNIESDKFVDLSGYQLTHPFYLYPAVIQPRKNHQILMRAIAMLRQRGCPKRHFVFVGGGDPKLKRRLEAEALAAGISDWIRFLGYVPSEVVSELYRRCHATISCSTWEAGIASIQEGCAVGRPALCSRIAPAVAHCKLLNLEAGLFDPSDPASIAATIIDFEEHYERYLSSAQVAKDVIRKFDYDLIGRRLADVAAFAADRGPVPDWAPYRAP